MSGHEARGRAAARRIAGAAAAEYTEFQGAEPDRTFELELPIEGRRLVELGEAEQLVYHEPAGLPSHKGDYNYRHQFGDLGPGDTGARPLVLAPEGLPGVLLIVTKPGDRKFTIESRGIVG
jgi:hypothetical protein